MHTPDVEVPHGSSEGTINNGKVTADKLAANAVTTAKVADSAVTANKLASNAVATAKIATDAVTGPKLASGAVTQLVCTGRNGAGACTLTGAKVGDKVIGNINLTDAADAKASFETTITVADQIQQSSASDLSTKKFAVTLVVKS